jgi:hypothetical protein
MFLVFADGTHYELYDIDSLNGARSVDTGGPSAFGYPAPASASGLRQTSQPAAGGREFF